MVRRGQATAWKKVWTRTRAGTEVRMSVSPRNVKGHVIHGDTLFIKSEI